MLYRLLSVFAATAVLAGCGDEKLACNYNGEVIIPADASLEDHARWTAENEELALRRFDVKIGNTESTRNYTKESLEKAASCA